MYGKLGVTSRVQLVVRVFDELLLRSVVQRVIGSEQPQHLLQKTHRLTFR